MKNIYVIFISLLVSSASFAGDGGGSDGCGLGWQVTKKKSFFATTTRGTTNAIIPPTFGMTSGTIGCDSHSIANKEERAAVEYVAVNYEPLLLDIAKGQGDYLAGFSEVMGCNKNSLTEFSSVTQKNFESLSTQKDAPAVIDVMKLKMKENPILAQSCAII